MAADGSVIIDIKGDASQFRSAMSGLGGVAKTALTGVVTAVTAAATALATLGAAAVKAGIEFESAFAGVQKTVDATDAELAALRDGILSLSEQMPQSASAIAGVAEAAGQLGIETDNILGFTETMVQLGDATNLSSEEAATSLARLANITGMSQADFDRLGSTIVALGNNMATTEAEIVEMGARIAGAGAQVGMSEAEIMSFSAALSSLGVGAEAGGTAFSTLISKISLATQTGGAELQQFAEVAGMSADEFAAAFEQDAAGAIMSFIEGLGGLEAEGESAIAVLDAMGLSDIRMRDALLRAAGGVDIFSEALEIGSAAWEENTALANEAAQRYATVESQLAILGNKFTNLGIAIYDGLREPLVETIGVISGFVDQLSSAFDTGGLSGLVSELGTVFADVVTYIAAQAPAAINAGADMIMSFLSGIQSNLPAIATGAVGIGIALIQGIISILPELLVVGVQLIAELANGIASALPTLIPAAVQAVVSLVQGLTSNISLVIEAGMALLQGLLEGIITAIPMLVSQIPAIITGIVNALLTGIPLIIEAGIALLTALVQGLPEIISAIVAVLPQIITSVITALVGNIGLIIDAGVQLLVALVQNLPAIIAGIVSAIPQIISAIVQGFFALIGSIVDLGVEVVSSIWDGIVSMADWLWSQVTGFFSDLWDGVKEFFGVGGEEAGAAGMEGVASGVANNEPAAVSAATNAAANITATLNEDLETGGTEAGAGAMDGVASGVTSNTPAAESAVATAADSLTSNLDSNLQTGGAAAGAGLMDNVASSAVSTLPAVQSAGDESVNVFTTAIEDGQGEVTSAGESTAEALADGITSGSGQVTDAASQTVSAANDAILSYSGEFQSAGRELMNGFNAGLQSAGQTAIATARSIANQCAETMRQALDIHSPSRVLKEIGAYAIEGYVVGVESKVNDVADVMDSVGNMVLDAFPEDAMKEQAKSFLAYYENFLSDYASKTKDYAADVEASLDEVMGRWEAVEQEQASLAGKLSDYGELLGVRQYESGDVPVLHNLQKQIDSMTAYGEALDALKERGISESLMSEVLGMSVEDALTYSSLLLQQSDEDWAAYMAQWEEKQALAQRIAEDYYAEELDALESEYTDKLQQGLDGMKDITYEAGQMTMEGLLEGFKSQEAALYAKTQEIADRIISTLQSALQIHSPSRVFENLGDMTMAGFVGSLRTGADEAVAEVEDMAERVRRAADIRTDITGAQGDVMSRLKNAVESEVVRFSAGLSVVSNAPEEARTAARNGQAVQAAGLLAAANMAGGEREIVMRVNGVEFGRAIIPDIRAVEDQSPRIVSD